MDIRSSQSPVSSQLSGKALEARSSFCALVLAAGLSLTLVSLTLGGMPAQAQEQAQEQAHEQIWDARPLDLRSVYHADFPDGQAETEYDPNPVVVDRSGAADSMTSDWSVAGRYALDRHRLDAGTRLTGWQLRDGLYFGRSKGDLSGVALVWQASQTQQVSLSGSGLRLTRRLRQ